MIKLLYVAMYVLCENLKSSWTHHYYVIKKKKVPELSSSAKNACIIANCPEYVYS